MVVQLGHINFPVDRGLGAVFNLDGQVSSVVVAAELRGWHGAGTDSSSSWCLLDLLFYGLQC